MGRVVLGLHMFEGLGASGLEAPHADQNPRRICKFPSPKP